MSLPYQKEKAPELQTAASVISYVSRIEQGSSDLYENWAQKYEELKAIFQSFAEDNKKHEKAVRRAYYSVVSDALETNFCFEGLRADVVLPLFDSESSLSAILKASIDLELAIGAFYRTAANISRALLADVPRAMERVARLREARVERLRALLEGE